MSFLDWRKKSHWLFIAALGLLLIVRQWFSKRNRKFGLIKDVKKRKDSKEIKKDKGSVRAMFDLAVARSKTLSNLSQENQLELYAFFKQANVGPCTSERPALYEFRARAKFDAWNALGEMSVEEAMRKYVSLVESFFPGTFNAAEEVAKGIDASQITVPDVSLMERKQKKKQSFGPVQSVLAMPSDDRNSSNSDDKKDIFYYASVGDLNKVECLLNDGADINSHGPDGGTVLHWACDRGHEDLIKLLIRRGAKIDALDNDQMTPLAMACCCEHNECALLLLKAGADETLKNEDGECAKDFFTDELKVMVKNL